MSAVDFERFRQNFANIIENLVGRQIDYTKLYPSVVTAQNADGTLQLIPDNKKVQGTGHNNIKIRHGLPGVSVEVSSGARVRLGFENGDPSQPYAALWDRNAAFAEINLGQSTEFVALANLVKDELDKIEIAHNTHTHITTATVSAGAPGILAAPAVTYTPSDVAATKVKAE